MRKLYESDRLNQSNIIDEDITLKKLYKRDEGICYICGDGCDYEDKYITNEGYFVVGKKYPSIDHVVALSNGGKHSWENVKLAHHYCNTIKRDNLIDNNSKSLV